MKKHFLFLSVCFVLLFASFLLSPPVSGETLSYAVIFVNSLDDSCSDRNYKALEFYEAVTDQYLTKYGISHNQQSSLCITQSELDDYGSELKMYDLPIIILDANIGLDTLVFQKGLLGHYIWTSTGERHIVFGSFTPFVESDTGAWLLSHELSHFALHYKGEPDSIMGDWVHSIQAQAEDCLGEDQSLNDCPELWTTVKAPSGKDIKVMKIYDEYPNSNPQPTYSSEIQYESPNTGVSTTYDESASYKCQEAYLDQNYYEAIGCYESILGEIPYGSPDYTRALNDLAESYHNVGDYENAISYYNELLDLDPNDFYSIVGICYVYYDAGDYESAVKYGKQAIGMRPTDVSADICLYYSESKLQSSKPTSQTPPLQPKPNIIPPSQSNSYKYSDNEDELYNLLISGGKMLDQEKFWDAIYYYDKVLLIDPNDVDALHNKGFALDSLGKHEESIVYYDKVLLIDPNDVDALNNKGVALESLGKYKEALFYYDKVLEIDPNDSLARENKEYLIGELASNKSKQGGGCLIATATYGSEMATEVQQLRELRDNSLLHTESGTKFMGMFNDVYYSFSPIIADYERENPIFKEMVKVAITPMISSLSILNYVDMDSESEVLGYGISLILLNGMMYVGIPAIVVIGIRKRF